MSEKIKLIKKQLKGEDGYKTFSIRVRDEFVEKLNQIAIETGMSRNEIIGTFIHYGVEHYEIVAAEEAEEADAATT